MTSESELKLSCLSAGPEGRDPVRRSLPANAGEAAPGGNLEATRWTCRTADGATSPAQPSLKGRSPAARYAGRPARDSPGNRTRATGLLARIVQLILRCMR